MSTQPRPVDYDRISQAYDNYRNWDQEIPLRLLSLAARNGTGNGASVLLELGCGTGNLTRWLRVHWKGPVIALDQSRGMLGKAQSKFQDVRLVRGDARALPMHPHSIHTAVGSFFLHHLDAPGRAQLFTGLNRAMSRARGSGGAAFLTSSHAQIRACSLARWMPSVASIDCARFPDLEVLRAELNAAGFGQIAYEEIRREEPRGDRKFLEKTRARFLSTLELVPADEMAHGLKTMEKQLASDGHLGDVSWNATIVYTQAGG